MAKLTQQPKTLRELIEILEHQETTANNLGLKGDIPIHLRVYGEGDNHKITDVGLWWKEDDDDPDPHVDIMFEMETGQ